MTKAIAKMSRAASSISRRFVLPNQAAFLSQAILLEEAGPPRMPAMVCCLGFSFVTIAVLAGMLIQIDVVTSGTGRLVAVDGNQTLQSFDGGIVEQIAVEEGQIVRSGDLLLTLSDPEAEAQLDRLADREAALFSQVRRLQALLALPTADAIDGHNDRQAIKDEQMSILRFETEALSSERALAEAEIDRRSKSFRNAQALEKDAKRRLALIQDKLRTDRQLADKGLLPKAQLLEIERQAIDAASDVKDIEGQIKETEASLTESIKRLDNLIASKKQQQADQLSSTLIEFNEVRQQIRAVSRRLSRSNIKATASGVIMELKVSHPGQTVAPGDPVIEIITLDNGLRAEIRLPPSEISHIRTGQEVRIAIDGIEPHRHGYMEGEITSVSPSTFIDENALPYYRAYVDLRNEQLNGIPLTPGMTVRGQIQTDQRTIFEYLLKPVYRVWNTAFRER